MKISEIIKILNAELLTNAQAEAIEINSACGSDLMSDVLAFVKNQAMLLTGLVNPQVIRTAEMMDMKVIAFVRGKCPTPEVLELAESMDITILKTEYPLFIACGKLYKNGLGNEGA